MTDLRRWVLWEHLANVETYEIMGQTGLLTQRMPWGRTRVNTSRRGGGTLPMAAALTGILERLVRGWEGPPADSEGEKGPWDPHGSAKHEQ